MYFHVANLRNWLLITCIVAKYAEIWSRFYNNMDENC